MVWSHNYISVFKNKQFRSKIELIVKSHSETVKYRCIWFVALSKPPSIWRPGNELSSTLIMFDQNFSQLSGTFKTSVSWNWNDKDSKLRLLQRKAGQQDFRPLSSYVESHITKNSETFSSSKWPDERYYILIVHPMDSGKKTNNQTNKKSLLVLFPHKEKYNIFTIIIWKWLL